MGKARPFNYGKGFSTLALAPKAVPLFCKRPGDFIRPLTTNQLCDPRQQKKTNNTNMPLAKPNWNEPFQFRLFPPVFWVRGALRGKPAGNFCSQWSLFYFQPSKPMLQTSFFFLCNFVAFAPKLDGGLPSLARGQDGRHEKKTNPSLQLSFFLLPPRAA